jgi:hypothetical protein
MNSLKRLAALQPSASAMPRTVRANRRKGRLCRPNSTPGYGAVTRAGAKGRSACAAAVFCFSLGTRRPVCTGAGAECQRARQRASGGGRRNPDDTTGRQPGPRPLVQLRLPFVQARALWL